MQREYRILFKLDGRTEEACICAENEKAALANLATIYPAALYIAHQSVGIRPVKLEDSKPSEKHKPERPSVFAPVERSKPALVADGAQAEKPKSEAPLKPAAAANSNHRMPGPTPVSTPAANTAPVAKGSEMSEYVYILSNPSMPGLVKIGKTTRAPSQRMDDLHSTGVPTPFDLEFAVEVADCHASEQAAHAILRAHRVSPNREFFKISARNAILAILPAMGKYKLVVASGSHGIEEIEIQLKQQREQAQAESTKRRVQAEAESRKRREEEENRRASEERDRARVKVQRLDELRRQLANARAKLIALGPRPVLGSNELITFLTLCWVPFPFGFLVWLGALSAFNRTNYEVGYACVGLLFFGFIAYKDGKESQSAFSKLVAPFLPIETDIFRLEAEIRSEGADPGVPLKVLPSAPSPSSAPAPSPAPAQKQADNAVKYRPFAEEIVVREASKSAVFTANRSQRAAVERYDQFARERDERQAREQAVRDKTALALAKLPENERQTREAWCNYHLKQGMDVRKYVS